MQSIGIGVLSFAHGHAVTYCDVLQNNSGARLVAAWDDHAARGKQNATRFGMTFCDAPDAVLARDDVNAVIIASETNRHADLIEAACAAGKNILCQKPMATTLEDCDRIIAAVEKSGVHFQMAFQMRCDPINIQLKKWIDDGEVGRVGSLRRRHCINFLFNSEIKNGPSAWHVDAEQNVGMFFDDATHAADFLYWIFGKPHSVMAEIDNILTDVAPDDTGLAIYRWKDGPMGVLFNSSVTLAGENTTEIYGDEGVIIQNYDDAVSVTHAPPNAVALKLFRKSTGEWETFEHVLPPNHGLRLQAVAPAWIETLSSGAPSTVTARDGKVSVEMGLAAYESAREGRRVEF